MSAAPSTGSSGSGAPPSATNSSTRPVAATGRAGDTVARIADALLAVVLAPVCAGCATVLERPLDGPVCAACWAAATSRTFRTFHSGLIAAGRSAGDYEGALKEIIHALKYDRRRTLSPRLGAMLLEAGRELLDDVSCTVPVPLHPWRRVHRGFNQAADLAAALPVPVVHALWRTRWTSPQTSLTAGARRRNVRGAFRLSPFLSRATIQSVLADRTILVVDDVRTTGATLDACAHVLRDAGAREVRALTVALADRPGPS